MNLDDRIREAVTQDFREWRLTPFSPFGPPAPIDHTKALILKLYEEWEEQCDPQKRAP